jgi:hypothetical protein
MRLAALVQNRLGLGGHVHRIPPCCRCDKAAGATMLAGFAAMWNPPCQRFVGELLAARGAC